MKKHMMNNKIWKIKKSESLLVDFWAILIFAILLLLIFILFWATKRSQDFDQVELRFAELQSKTLLNSYLKAPYGDGTISDVIVNDFYANDYTNTENSFYKFFKGIRLFSGNIEDTYYRHGYIYCIHMTINRGRVFSITNREYSNKIEYKTDESKCKEIELANAKFTHISSAQANIPSQLGTDVNVLIEEYYTDRPIQQ